MVKKSLEIFPSKDSNNKAIVSKRWHQSLSLILQCVHQTVENFFTKAPGIHTGSWSGKRIPLPTVCLSTASKVLSFCKSILSISF